jgi:hypothetical protein
MSTAGQIITKAKRHLLGGITEERNRLTSTLASGTTSVVLDFGLAGFREGTVFEIDLEAFYVWSAVAGTRTLTVERGYQGTTAAAHTAGAIATLAPRFPRQQSMDALNGELNDLSSPSNGLYAVVETSLTGYNGSDRMINLTSATNVIDLIEVRHRELATDFIPQRNYYLQRQLPTADFASGYAITFNELPPPGTLRVVYSKTFTNVTLEADDLQTVALLPATCEDIAELGVAIRLMAGREVKRTFPETQGETRRADEIPSGSTNQSASALRALRRDRIMAEATRLLQRYPKTVRR